MVNSLSGRLLVLTVIFVMLAEIFVFVPSVARFRIEFIEQRMNEAELIKHTALALDENPNAARLPNEILEMAGIFNIFERDDRSRIIMQRPFEGDVTTVVRLDEQGVWQLIADAMRRLILHDGQLIHVIGATGDAGTVPTEITMPSDVLHREMLIYGRNILLLSAAISVIAAVLLFLAGRRFLVRPIKRVVSNMQLYAEDPEDARRIITPQASINELRDAEIALNGLQTQLSSGLKQRGRLAQLGGAVAKISHDLRNILTTATLLADRMERSTDPAVKRIAPKLVNSLSRAVNLCESTLAFGRVEEAPPKLQVTPINDVIEDVIEGEKLAASDAVTFIEDVPANQSMRHDKEQMFRVIGNLVRNARQAIEASGQPGTITIATGETEEDWTICVSDTGPGLPPKAREHLFTPFEGGVRKGGTGLGLAIASELMRGHGGMLELTKSDQTGTSFTLRLPKKSLGFDIAAPTPPIAAK